MRSSNYETNERRQAQLQVEKLDSVISVLEELIGRNSTAPVRRGGGHGRVVSAAAPRRMAAAQRARWARERAETPATVGGKVRTTSRRRKLSAAGSKSISAAAKARWARFRWRKISPPVLSRIGDERRLTFNQPWGTF